MLRLRDYVSNVRKSGDKGVTRRMFLSDSAFLIVGGSVIGWVGCGGASDPVGVGDGDNGDTTPPIDNNPPIENDPPDEGNGDVEPPPVDDPPPVDEKPPGVEVEMDNSLKDVGGTQRVNDRDVLAELDTDNNGRGDEPILLIRVADDEVAAVTTTCTHQQCAVAYNEGQERLDCPCHGSRFDVDGSVIQGPALRPLLSFKATIHEDSVFLEPA